LNHKSFRFGQWRVNPATNTLNSGELSRQIEPRAMDVLLHLARHPHTVISAETLLDACWGDSPASDNAVHKIITQLRRALDDSASEPRYIETIRKRGYRLVAELSYEDDVSQGSWTHASPFRGLEAFEEQHAAIFYGRKLSVDRLVHVAVQQVQAACAMVLVLGPSGAGKTSLIQAGLIPALKAGAAPADAGIAITDHVQIDCADMGQSGLLETLGSTLLDAEIDGCQLFENTSAAALARYMEQDLPGLIAHLQAQLPALRLAVFIDRFEAVFRLPHITEAERVVFINVLDQLARSGCMLLVLACRNDFYPHLTVYPALMNMKLRGGHFDLAPPGSADIAQIVRHPAQAAQLRYTVDQHGEALDDLLCHAAKAGPDTLPLLQYCLQELYRQRTPAGELTHAAFHQMGGLEGAIGARAEQVISSLGPAQIAALPQLLSRLVLVAEDEATVTARRVPWSDVSNGDETKLLQALVDAHLFVSDLHGGAPAFGIAHEALLRRWPRVVAWVDEHRQALQTRSRISAQARRWQDSGRKRDMLLPSGTQANQARELVRKALFNFTATERSFIDSSLAGARRTERLRVGIMAMMTFLVMLAGGLGLSAHASRVLAEQHRTEAEGMMTYMLGEFVEKLRPLGKLDLLDSVSTRSMAYLSHHVDNDDSAVALTQRAKSLQIIAEVRYARSDSDGAVTALRAGSTILSHQLKADPNNLAVLKSAGENAFWLGKIDLDRKDLDGAQRFFEHYRDYSKRQAVISPSSIDVWIEQSYAHNSIGSVALRRGDVELAAKEFAASLALKTRAYNASPKNKQLQADLADSLSWLAQTNMQTGKLDHATDLYRQELALLQDLRDRYPSEALWLNRLSSAWSHQAEVKRARGELAASGTDLQNAQTLLEQIVNRDASNRSWQRNLHFAQLKLIEANLTDQNAAASLDRIEVLGQRFDDLIVLDPKRVALKTMRSELGYIKAAAETRIGRSSKALASLQPAIAALQALQTSGNSDMAVKNALAKALLLQADLLKTTDPATAKKNCETVRDMYASLIGSSNDFKLLSPWVKAVHCLGQSGLAISAREKLEAMAYRDPDYVQYLSNH